MPRFQYLEFRQSDSCSVISPSPERIDVERTRIASALAQSPAHFKMDVQVPENEAAVAVWLRTGLASGSLVWLRNDKPVARAVFVGGRNDDDDNRALWSVENAQDIGHGKPAFATVRVTCRPLVAVFFQDEQVAGKLPVVEQSLCMAETFFAATGATEHAAPLGELDVKPAKYFYRFDVNPEGRHGSSRINFSHLRAIRDLLPTIDTFVSRLMDSPEGFEQWLQFRQAPKFTFTWRASAPTAGYAFMRYGDSGYEERMMFLSGLDAAAEVSVIHEFEVRLPRSIPPEESRKTFDDIRSGPRPLLVTFGDKGPGEGDASIDLVQWCFAGAFFRMRGVA